MIFLLAIYNFGGKIRYRFYNFDLGDQVDLRLLEPVLRCVLFTMLGTITLSLPVFSQIDSESKEEEKNEGDRSVNPSEELSLGSLLDLSVSVTTGDDQSLLTAPGVVTVYKSRDIRALAKDSIYELADITAGYGSYYIFGERVLSTRGEKADSFNNNKHILLIDGLPIYNARNYKVPVEEEIPLGGYAQVTFLRGPSSSLYGTGAFLGTINLVPKRLDKNGSETRTEIGLGNRDQFKLSATHTSRTDKGAVSIDLGSYSRSPSLANLGPEGNTLNKQYDDVDTYFVNANTRFTEGVLKGLKFGLISFQKAGGLGEHWMGAGTTFEANEVKWKSIIPNISYNRDVSEAMSVKAYVLYNRSSERGVTGGWFPYDTYDQYSGKGAPGSSYEDTIINVNSLVEVNFDFGSDNKLKIGFNRDQRRSLGVKSTSFNGFIDSNGDDVIDAGTVPVAENITEKSELYIIHSLYAQYQQDFDFGMNVTTGLRADSGTGNGETYSKVSPRLGLVQMISDTMSVKALYGQALRAPNYKEYSLNAESEPVLAVKGEDLKELKPETIGSLELSLQYQSEKLTGNLTVFQSDTKDSLRSVNFTGTNGFENGGEISSKGFEFQVKGYVTPTLSIWANATKSETKEKVDNNGVEEETDFADTPLSTYRLGIVYQDSKLLGSVSVNNVTGFGKKFEDDDDERFEGFNVVDVNVGYKITDNSSLSLKVDNVSDTKYFYPKSHSAGDLNWDTKGHGRSFMFSIENRI